MIKNIIFDAFGTLVDIKDKNHPYRLLYEDLIRAYGYPKDPDYAKKAMTFNGGFNAFIRQRIGCVVNGVTLTKVEQALYNDLASIRKFPEVDTMIAQLKKLNINVGICSNLATPYTVALDMLFPATFDPDHRAMSCEVGAIKPDPEIYKVALGNWDRNETLFVGDTYSADLVGPRSLGIHAILLDRMLLDDVTTDDTIQDLTQLHYVIHQINLGSHDYKIV